MRTIVLTLIFSAALMTACSNASASLLHDFTSDGCSLFPDGTAKERTRWCDCCFDHDIAYWRGGTEEERKRSDQTLKECILRRTGSKALADLMYNGVRLGGHPVFPNWYRWGYGWDYGRDYAPLTKEEQQQFVDKLELYREKNPEGYCGEK